MKKTINGREFSEAFDRMGRGDQFSDEGQSALWDYYEELEESTGEETELDIIATCCDFTEYDSIADYNQDMGTEYDDWDEMDRDTDALIKELSDGGAIVRNI